MERAISDISTRILVKELKHLAAKKVVIRKSYVTVPPTVKYSLSEMGKFYAEAMLKKS